MRPHRAPGTRPDDLYMAPPRWDIGRPQAVFRERADVGALGGRLLDVGCGTGEHALMCAGLGCGVADVTGIDLAGNALEAARTKARERGLQARFLQLDALGLGGLGESFDTVLDCGLFHVIDLADRRAYVDALAAVTRSGARYFMLCFSGEQPGDWGPHRVRRSAITVAFADGWRIYTIEPAAIEVTIDPAGMRAWSVATTRS